MTTRGYFNIGIYFPQRSVNIGGLWRSALIWGANSIFTIGPKYSYQASDTTHTSQNIPLIQYKTFEDFYEHLPYGCRLIGIENSNETSTLSKFQHPLLATYLLGSEGNGLPINILNNCHSTIRIETALAIPLNVTTAGSIVMYHRYLQPRWKTPVRIKRLYSS